MIRDKQINFRATQETIDMVRELSKGENRTISNYMETLIRREYLSLQNDKGNRKSEE